MSDYIDGLLYDGENCWVKVDGNIATIGITEPSALKVTEFVFIELPEVGDMIKRGRDFVTLESIKWAGTVKSPITGKVIDVNKALEDDPSAINDDAYSAWIMKVAIFDDKEITDLKKKDEMSE